MQQSDKQIFVVLMNEFFFTGFELRLSFTRRATARTTTFVDPCSIHEILLLENINLLLQIILRQNNVCGLFAFLVSRFLVSPLLPVLCYFFWCRANFLKSCLLGLQNNIVSKSKHPHRIPISDFSLPIQTFSRVFCLPLQYMFSFLDSVASKGKTNVWKPTCFGFGLDVLCVVKFPIWYCYSVTTHCIGLWLFHAEDVVRAGDCSLPWEPELVSPFTRLVRDGWLVLVVVWGFGCFAFHRPWPFLLIALYNYDNTSAAQWLPQL